MQSIQTSYLFELAEVKPLEKLLAYREFCLETTRKALVQKSLKRGLSPIDGTSLQPWGWVEGFEYRQCSATGSLFLAEVAPAPVWGELLQEVAKFRHSPRAFHQDIHRQRIENVLEPKRIWIQNTLGLQEIDSPVLLDVSTPPSDFAALIQKQGIFKSVTAMNETELLMEENPREVADVATLFESLDRVNDPGRLINNIAKNLRHGGLLFVTSLVASGFDSLLLGKDIAYLFPPDRANFFTLRGLKSLIHHAGFELLEVSTPGVLDVEVVRAHLKKNPDLKLSAFEGAILESDREGQLAFQTFLQRSNFSSYARLVARKNGN